MPKPFPPVFKAIPAQPATAILATTLSIVSAASAAGALEIKVYTVSSIPVTAPAEATIGHLDATEMIEARLSARLPHNPTNAVNLVRQRLQDGGAPLQREFAAAYQDIAEAWSLGITTLPAVVVDRRYVIYGEADVARAIARIETFQRKQP